MAGMLPDVPLVFFNSRMKYALINWIANQGLPARIGRQILQQWGEAVGVEVTAGDYQLIDSHLRTVAG